jgi:hypothetical protein
MYGSEILGSELTMPVQADLYAEQTLPPPIAPAQPEQPTPVRASVSDIMSQDPVVSILDKTKKRNEKITLTLNVRIPSPDLYNVIKENFDNVDETLLNSVMDQIQHDQLKDAMKRELQNIYSTKRKKA